MLSTKITRKGQITIPVEIRNELDLREGDVLVVERTESGILLKNQRWLAESTAGILKDYARGVPPLEDRSWFEAAVAEEVIASMTTDDE